MFGHNVTQGLTQWKTTVRLTHVGLVFRLCIGRVIYLFNIIFKETMHFLFTCFFSFLACRREIL